ncbi:hypothetical protein [Cellulophaga sp. Ld12]|uniref:hypothetical protein n=1 Tax=Cellulophaga sp. Ld12 TaxID=3229535 RepID=UPI00386FBBF7
MKKNAFIIFIVLTILMTPFFVSTFTPPSGTRTMAAALRPFIDGVIRWLFGIFLFIACFLALAIYGRKNP